MVVLISIYTAKYSDSMPECIFRLIITRWIGIWDNISCYRFYLPDYLPLNIDHSRNLPVENCGMNYTEKYATL